MRRLTTLGVTVLGLAACSGLAASTPDQGLPASSIRQSTPVGPEAGEPVTESTPTWQSSLRPKADTFYLGKGELPTPVVDRTETSTSGRLLLRADCDKGTLRPSITVDGSPQPSSFACDGTRHETFLTDVRKGQQVVIHAEGDDGTRFAMELVIRRDADPA